MSALFSKNIYVANDHAGLALKKYIFEKFPQLSFKDLGTKDEKSVDYPDYAEKVAHSLLAEDDAMGLLICGSGQGMAIKANRYPHIRAALCWTPEVAELSRAHNNANVLCLGGRLLAHNLALQITEKFFSTPFEGGRHETRVNKLG